jgi:hypothetical protein
MQELSSTLVAYPGNLFGCFSSNRLTKDICGGYLWRLEFPQTHRQVGPEDKKNQFGGDARLVVLGRWSYPWCVYYCSYIRLSLYISKGSLAYSIIYDRSTLV